MGMLKMSINVSKIASFLNIWMGYVRELTKLSSPKGLDVKYITPFQFLMILTIDLLAKAIYY
jgi:hypothetical protein